MLAFYFMTTLNDCKNAKIFFFLTIVLISFKSV